MAEPFSWWNVWGENTFSANYHPSLHYPNCANDLLQLSHKSTMLYSCLSTCKTGVPQQHPSFHLLAGCWLANQAVSMQPLARVHFSPPSAWASPLSWCFTSKETTRLIRGRRMEVGEEGNYLLWPIATLSPVGYIPIATLSPPDYIPIATLSSPDYIPIATLSPQEWLLH